MAFVYEAGVGDVDADPVPGDDVQAHVHPGVAGQVGLVGGVKVAADVPGRVAQTSANRNHHVGLVLAHAAACLKRLKCRCGDV